MANMDFQASVASRTHLLDLCNPVPNGVKGFLVRYVVNEKDSLRASEIGGRDGAEAFLSRGVPDLQLDSLGITERKGETPCGW